MSQITNLALSVDNNFKRANPGTIKNKFLVGYQGWFYCHGDGEPVGPGHHGWIHWFTYPVPDGGSPNIDYWPDTSQYAQEELFDAPGFKHKNGKQAHLFSSRHPKTVQRHFHWMAQNGVDGVFLQRFVGLCDMAGGGNEGNRRIRDEVGDNVQRAAEREGRVYAIMYDISGVDPGRVQEIIEADWYHLLQEKRVLNSPNYLREDGKPVIAIWGFGFNDSKHTPDQMRALTSFFRNSTPGGAYLVAGTPAHWRTSDSDADRNPEFVTTWMQSFDALSPWTVGRYSDQHSADAFAEDRIQGDVMFIARWGMDHGRRVDYMPVVHPGGSGFNTSNGQWTRNAAPREGGRFLYRQIYNARKWGAHIMYGAMWDEYDEGTQFLPAITKTADLPEDGERKFTLIAYDVDGYDVPPDWYMRIAGYGSELVKDERFLEDRFPEKELRDWPNTHPKYEAPQSMLASGSNSGGPSGQGPSWAQEEVPPPPYSLEVHGNMRVQTATSHGPETPISTRPLLAQRDSLLRPPLPQRPNSQPVATAPPPIPFSSRPTSMPSSAPQTPVVLEHRPPPTVRLSPTASPHLSTTQLAPIQTLYPGQQLTAPQAPSQHQTHDSTSLSSYIVPTMQFPMPSFSAPQPDAWPHQDWNQPQPSPPAHFPSPHGQVPYGFAGGYNQPIAFPETMRPAGLGDYSFSTPQVLHHPGPPPLQPRPSNARSGRTSQTLHSPLDSTRPPHSPTRSISKSPSPRPGDSLPPPPPLRHDRDHQSRSRSPSGADTKRKEGILQRGLGSVSAAGSKVLNKITHGK